MSSIFDARDFTGDVSNFAGHPIVNDVITFDVMLDQYDDVTPRLLEEELNEIMTSQQDGSEDNKLENIEIYCELIYCNKI